MKLLIGSWTRLRKLFWEKIKYYCKNFWNVTCETSCNPECNIPVFIVQFFTMHEILHTYRFWVFDEKTPSLLFMLREEEFFFVTTISSVLMNNIQASWRYFPKLHFRRSIMYLLVTLWFFPFFKTFFCRSILCSPLVPYATWCMMLMLCEMKRWCYAMWGDVHSEDTYASLQWKHNLL